MTPKLNIPTFFSELHSPKLRSRKVKMSSSQVLEEGKHEIYSSIRCGYNLTSLPRSVAIQALQFAVAKGANVYVTSSKQDKIDRAKEMGAKGGVNYKEEDWAKKLAALLPKERPTLDAVIDSAGGNVTTQLLRVLKHGARVAVYGQ